MKSLAKSLSVIMTIFSLLKKIFPVGIIDSDVTLPIGNTLANEDEYADYTFRFNLTTKLLKGGYLEVVFPNQYQSGLGIPLLPSCSVTCDRFERTVNFYFGFDLFPTVIYNMTIKEIKNPPTTGGTGQFLIRSKRGANILDESMIFGILGVGGSIQNLTSTTVAVDSVDGAQAGEISKYVFSFKTNMFLYSNIYVKLYLPKGAFEVSPRPSCSSFEINGVLVPGNFHCTYQQEFDTIEVRGFSENIQEGGEVGISVSMRNPQFSYITGTFNIVVYKERTTLAYTRKLEIQGVPIIAGKITQISLLPLDSFFLVSKKKLMWYRLGFKLTNPLNDGAMIQIKIPDSMILSTDDVLGQPSSFYVESGIEDNNDESPMKISYFDNAGSRYIRIENFKAQPKPDRINVVMLLTLPASSGLSLPFEIRSFRSTNGINEIDKDLSTARIDVSPINKPVSNSLTASVTIADGVSYSDLLFSLEPAKTLNGHGSIKLLIDGRLETLGVDGASCQVWLKNLGIYEDSPSCTKRDRDIYIKISSQPYSLGIQSTFQLNGVIRSPKLAGDYFIEVQTVSPEGNILESYTEKLTFTATPLINYQVDPFPNKFLREVTYATRYHRGVHEIQFNTPYRIPAAKVQEKATDLVSFIQIQYGLTGGSSAYLKTDLGMGVGAPLVGVHKIPCKSIRGLQPISGYNINCTLITGAEPKIEIRNFQTVEEGENILIYIPNVKNPRYTWSLTTRLVTKQNRLYKEISSGTINYYSAYGAAESTFKLDVADTGTFFNYVESHTYISQDFSFDNTVDYTGNQPGGTRFLFKFPKFDVGYIPEEGHVTCRIDDVAFNCFQFTGLDWVYGQTAPGQDINLIKSVILGDSILHISNVRWPRYLPATAITTALQLLIIKTDNNWEKIINYPPFNPPTIYPFISTRLNVDKKRRKEVDSTYTFRFLPTNTIPAGGTVVLTIPSVYNLIASFPRVEISYPELLDLQENAKVSHTYTANVITISNMAEHPGKVPFRIIIKGMRNPNIAVPISGFSIKTLLQGNDINVSDNFLTIELGSLFSPGIVLADPIQVFPTNNLAYAKYTFAFTLQTKLSVGSEIHIKFPSDYISLPQNPLCAVSGGLQTFESCEKLADEIVVKLDTEYITGEIVLTVDGILNPGIEKTQPFQIYTFYDGSIVDETTTATSNQREVALSLPASLISMREFYFDPVNEGEIANYVISFLPTNNIEEGMKIVLKFPTSFDQRLGKKIDIFFRSGLKGDIQTKIHERQITIWKFQKYTVSPDTPIKIEISGVMNPNRPLVGHSGYISVGAMRTGNNKYEDYLEQAAVVETTRSASWLVLRNITSSNGDARMGADYTINMIATDVVPKSAYEGKIYVDLPEQYEIRTGLVRCKNLTANLGQNTRCEINKRTVRLAGHPDDLTSQISFTLFDILNPLDEIRTHSLFVRTYDGFKREIIQRSFENLDPFQFEFKFPGPLIVVNEDKPIYVERGTQTRDLYIECSEIMALNLTFLPATPGFNFIPSPLEMRIGQKKIKFRVSVPMGFIDGDYYVEWVTKDDMDPPIYTPIRKTLVIITKKGNVPIQMKEINDIPLGGNSLPITFSTEYAPDIGIEVLLNLQKNYNGLKINKPSLVFEAGVNQQTFTVFFTDKNIQEADTVQSGIVEFEMIGVNREIFNLPKTFLKFNIIQKDTRSPEITDIQVLKITRTSVEFNFVCSDIATAYIVIALKGTQQPSWEELRSLGPAEFESTESQFGKVYVGKELEGYGAFEGLTAETDYVIYVFLEDRGENLIEAPGYAEFKTLDRYPASFVDLRFRQTYINSAERLLIAKRVAFILSLLPHKVEEKKYSFGTTLAPGETLTGTTTRRLQTTTTQDDLDDITSTITLTVLASPQSYVYPPPIEQASLLKLDLKKSKLAETFSNFDSDFVIEPRNFTKYDIGFSAIPRIVAVDYNTVNLTANLDNYGFIYAVALGKSEDLGKPTPAQIAKGLDYRNIPLPSGTVEINQKFILFEFSVPNLDSDTYYNLYLTAGSAHPGYPDLMHDKRTVFLEFKTLKAPVIPKLSLAFGQLVEAKVLIILGLLAVLFKFFD